VGFDCAGNPLQVIDSGSKDPSGPCRPGFSTFRHPKSPEVNEIAPAARACRRTILVCSAAPSDNALCTSKLREVERLALRFADSLPFSARARTIGNRGNERVDAVITECPVLPPQVHRGLYGRRSTPGRQSSGVISTAWPVRTRERASRVASALEAADAFAHGGARPRMGGPE
jgi:hypothetical protein